MPEKQAKVHILTMENPVRAVKTNDGLYFVAIGIGPQEPMVGIGTHDPAVARNLSRYFSDLADMLQTGVLKKTKPVILQ